VIAELDKLIELQQTDTNLRRLKALLDTAETRRADIEREFEEHAFSIRQIQGRRDEFNDTRRKLEAEVEKNKTLLERADRNLKHAQNQKEYESAMREADALQKQTAAHETAIVELMEQIETVEKELQERAEEINTLDAKRDAALKEFDTALKRDKSEHSAETAKRRTLFETMPERLAAVYDRLSSRSRDGLAVAEVINGSCTACYIALRPQVQLEVKRGDQIITCENCTRILYAPRVESSSTNS
jgi:uncharacterized protein